MTMAETPLTNIAQAWVEPQGERGCDRLHLVPVKPVDRRSVEYHRAPWSVVLPKRRKRVRQRFAAMVRRSRCRLAHWIDPYRHKDRW